MEQAKLGAYYTIHRGARQALEAKQIQNCFAFTLNLQSASRHWQGTSPTVWS